VVVNVAPPSRLRPGTAATVPEQYEATGPHLTPGQAEVPDGEWEETFGGSPLASGLPSHAMTTPDTSWDVTMKPLAESDLWTVSMTSASEDPS
jgi:hypothetical protein